MLVLGACLRLAASHPVGDRQNVPHRRIPARGEFRFITSENRRVLTVHLLQTPALNIGIRLADMSHTMRRRVRAGLYRGFKSL
jgi:hypothetical protein